MVGNLGCMICGLFSYSITPRKYGRKQSQENRVLLRDWQQLITLPGFLRPLFWAQPESSYKNLPQRWRIGQSSCSKRNRGTTNPSASQPSSGGSTSHGRTLTKSKQTPSSDHPNRSLPPRCGGTCDRTYRAESSSAEDGDGEYCSGAEDDAGDLETETNGVIMDISRKFVHGDVVSEFGTPACVDDTLHESGEGFERWECISITVIFLDFVIWLTVEYFLAAIEFI